MAGDRLKLGIIGVGRIAQAHIDAAVKLSERVTLTALCSRRAENMREAVARTGVTRLYTDWREMLTDPEVEAVIVCLPQDLHRDVSVAAAEAGRHVLVEKPMALDTVEATEMVTAADSAGVQLMVAQSRRFPRAVQELVRRLCHVNGPRRATHIARRLRPRRPRAIRQTPRLGIYGAFGGRSDGAGC